MAAGVALALGQPARAGTASCPSQSFLLFHDVVYASAPIGASQQPQQGPVIGSGELDEPESAADPCRRQRRTVQLTSIVGVDAGTAVLVAGERQAGYILGGRCSGYESAKRWSCVLAPVRFRNTVYTGISYPATPAPRGSVVLGEQLGETSFGDAGVAVRAIANVDPAVAVGLEGHANEAFVAPGVCPYERFANQASNDDLRRCLQGPIWFAFAPLGGQPGDRLTATGDRTASSALAGASVGLVQLRTAADAIPANHGPPTPIGTITVGTDGHVSLAFTIPDLPQGVYETVVTCPGCASAFGGRTEFPGGSILVLKKGSGSTSARIVYVILFAIVIALIGAAFVLWRRGYRVFRRQPPRAR